MAISFGKYEKKKIGYHNPILSKKMLNNYKIGLK